MTSKLNILTNDRVTSGRDSEVLYDALADDKLELTIFPTEHCNFRCTYCYEDFSIGRMKPEIALAVKNLISARADDLNSLSISWFGGEPMIAYDVVLDVNYHAQNLAQARQPRPIALNIGMTTNGYALSEARFRELHESGLRHYQISLDGFGEGHNLTRKRADGKGTFNQIWSNILTFERLRNNGELDGASIMLRLHVHPENAESCRRIADAIASQLSPQWFSFLIKNVGHYGGKNDGNFEVFSEASSTFGALKNEMMRTLDRFLPAMPTSEIHVCYAAKANAFTIRADGRIGKCTVALSSRSNDVGTLSANGALALDAAATGRWLHALNSLSISDLACPVQGLHKVPT